MTQSAPTVTLLLALASTTAFAGAPPQQATSPSAPAVPPAAAQAPVPVPAQAGVAPQPLETHGDWRVFCGSPNNQKVCVFSQVLSDKASGQRMLGMELRPSTADGLMVTIITPFGVAVDKPVTIRIDEGVPMTLPFKTCVQLGCVVTTTWEIPIVAELRKGTAVYISAIAAENGQEVGFRISLNGFGTALDRTVALTKQ
jgi:invasion protein IalB